MRLHTCITILAISFHLAHSYDLNWFKTSEPPVQSFGTRLAYDAGLKRIYSAGCFDTTVQAGIAISTAFVIALDTAGNIIWRTPIRKVGSGMVSNRYELSEPYGIATDGNGSIYVCGGCCDAIVIDTIVLPKGNGKTCNYYDLGDLYIAKLNTAGHAVWARRFEVQGQGMLEDIIITDEGLYLSCDVSGAMTYGTQTWQRPGNFICKFDLDGNLKWLQTLNTYWGTSCALSARRSNFFGILSNDIGIIYGDSVLVGNGRAGTMVFSFSRDGAVTIDSVYQGVSLHSRARATGNDGNLYFCGEFDSTLEIGSSRLVPAGGQCNYFVARVDSNGTFRWIRQQSFVANSSTSMSIGSNSLLWTNYGNILFSGSFTGTLAFDSETLTTVQVPNQTMNFDAFIFSFNSNGLCNWSTQTSSPGDETISALAKDGTSSIYATGRIDTTVFFMGRSIPWQSGQTWYTARLNETNTGVKLLAGGAAQRVRSRVCRILPAFSRLYLRNDVELFSITGRRIDMGGTAGPRKIGQGVLIIRSRAEIK